MSCQTQNQWRIQDFHDGEGAPSLKVGRQTIILSNFPRKLHKNETMGQRGVCDRSAPSRIRHRKRMPSTFR